MSWPDSLGAHPPMPATPPSLDAHIVPTASPSEIPAPLLPLLTILSTAYQTLSTLFYRLPGSAILVRYIKSSHQNDPYRSLLEVLLVAFALRTLLKGRTRGDSAGKTFIKFTEKEIDELVDEWQPLPLCDEAEGEMDEHMLETVPVIQGPNGVRVKLANGNGKVVLNMGAPDWCGFTENEKMKSVAIDTLKVYGVGSCGPSGFYGTFDVHTQLERDLAAFLGTEAAIIYSQSFATVSSVIPAFAKRGDIIVADRGVNFAIHKGLQISRSTIKYYAHGDMKDLERVLLHAERERKRKGGKLTRKFIITEGIFENDGMMVDLPKVMELMRKFKYRLMLDESQSFGMIGAHGRGVTEHYGIPASEVDMLIGSMASGLSAGGGFCAGSAVVCTHQRINSSASVFSAALPAMFASTSSAALSMLTSQPTLMTTLQANIALFRQQLAKIEPFLSQSLSSPSTPDTPSPPNKDALIQIPSHPSSALIHIFLLNPPPTHEEEEKLLQEVVDECLNHSGVIITRARRLKGQETFEHEPSLKVFMSGAFSKKEVEKAGQGLRSALVKACGKRR